MIIKKLFGVLTLPVNYFVKLEVNEDPVGAFYAFNMRNL